MCDFFSELAAGLVAIGLLLAGVLMLVIVFGGVVFLFL